MASSAALTTRAALSSQMLTDSSSALSAKSTPLQLASPIFGRKLAAAKAPAQLKARSSVVTAAVEWKNVPGKLTTISIGDGGALVGSNKTDDVYVWRDNNWQVLGGKLRQISTGAKGHWGVNSNSDVWNWDGTAWKNVVGKLKHVASGKEVWGVSPDDNIWKRNSKPIDDTTGLWDLIPGKLAQIDTNDFGDVWGVNSVNMVYRRVDDDWVHVPGPAGRNIIKHVTTGVMGVWAVDKDDVIYRWILGDTKDGAWHRDPKEGRLRNIDSGYDRTTQSGAPTVTTTSGSTRSATPKQRPQLWK